ncbi:MAG: outer membrane protein assembly factor BamA [Candidatus Binatia bacterium]
MTRVVRVAVLSVLLFGAAVVGVHAGVITEIRLDGAQRVDSDALTVEIGSTVGAPFDEKQIDADVKALFSMGFFQNVWVTREEVTGGTRLVYHVKERPYVEAVRFEGVRKVDIADLEAVVDVTPRTIFDPDKAAAGLIEAKKLYSREGYPDAVIDYELDVDANNNATVVYTVEEGSLIRISKIRFEGVSAFKPRKLRKLMTTRTKWFLSFLTGAGLLNEDELATDVERVASWYYDNGYIRVRIDEPVIKRVGNSLEVTFKIDEGPLFHVGEVAFHGELFLPPDELRATAELKSGEVFRASLLRESVFSLVEAYGNLGYAFAEVVPQTRIRPGERLVDVDFNMTSGPVVTVRRVEIRGNTKTRDKVVRRAVELEEGQRFSGSGLRESKAAVRRTGLFSEVDLTTRRTERDDEVDLLVTVAEGRTGTFAAGAGFSSADNVLFNARISEQNLFGRGQRLVLNADIGSIRQNFQFSFTEPWYRDRPLSLGIDLFDWRLDFDRFTRGGTGAAVRMSYPLRELGFESFYGQSLKHVRAGIEYRIEEAEINGVSSRPLPSVKDEEGKSLTSSISPRLTRNTLDHPFDPTRGSRQVLRAEIAGLGGKSDFFKLEFTGRWFMPVWETKGGREFIYSLGGSVSYGLGDTGKSGKELPLFERYFPGGINSVRGYDPRSLGPSEEFCDNTGASRNCFTESIGGSQQLIVNNELIIPIFKDAGLKGVLFVDGGNSFSADNGLDPTDLLYAVGWGVRWLSPMGPLRIEVGYPLNPREQDNGSVVSFSFGAPF